MKLAMLFLALTLGGACRATAPAPEVESVGALSASTTHVMAAAVHETTDLGIAYQAAGDTDDAPVAVSGEAVTPDVAPKSGLTMGSVR